MVYIKKGHEPNDLLIAKKRGLHRYDELHSDVKDSIKDALFSEQKGLCAYCMRRLNEKFHRNVPTKTDPKVAGESLLLFLRFSAEKGRSPAKSKIFFEIGKFLLTR